MANVNQDSIDHLADSIVASTLGDDTAAIRNEEKVETNDWSYSEKTDEMTDATSYFASLMSSNYIQLDFPYEGQTYARILVRYMKKYGQDVLIQLTQGQIHGSEYNGTDFILVRFDDEKPKKYQFSESADGDATVVFLDNPRDFIAKAKAAKEIKIEVPVFQGGNPLFKFSSSKSLQWDR